MTAGCEVTGHVVSEMHVLCGLLYPVKVFLEGDCIFIYLFGF